MKNTQYNIFFDMDGVACNFDKQFEILSGMHPILFESTYGKSRFWKLINAEGSKFWSEMEWMPGGEDLWNFVLNNFEHVVILTRPSSQKSSEIGKRIWVKNHMPQIDSDKDVFMAHHGKAPFCKGPNDVLIDDFTVNINPWNEAGGIGILHRSVPVSIMKLQQLL